VRWSVVLVENPTILPQLRSLSSNFSSQLCQKLNVVRYKRVSCCVLL
jgi:hypothetical protein